MPFMRPHYILCSSALQYTYRFHSSKPRNPFANNVPVKPLVLEIEGYHVSFRPFFHKLLHPGLDLITEWDQALKHHAQKTHEGMNQLDMVQAV